MDDASTRSILDAMSHRETLGAITEIDKVTEKRLYWVKTSGFVKCLLATMASEHV